MIEEPNPNTIDEDLIAKVKGRLLVNIIRGMLYNRWTTGWGLISRKGANGGVIELDPSVLPDGAKTYWRGKVTSSSASSEDHTVEEVNADDGIIPEADGGRKTETAKAHNGRKGVPSDTFVTVFEYPPTESDEYADYKFHIPDGLTASPKDLKGSGTAADTVTWNVEEDSSPAEYTPARAYADGRDMAIFGRTVRTDASGFVYSITAESKYSIFASNQDSPLGNHVCSRAIGTTDLEILLNQPQDQSYINKLTLAAGTGISLSSDPVFQMSEDNSGRNRDGSAGIDKTITISASGGNDGQGYEDVEVNGVSILAITDAGVINFKDKASPTTGHLPVKWNGANNTPEVTLEAEVDVSTLDAASVGGLTVIDEWIEGQALGTETVDADDYGGRVVHFAIYHNTNEPDADIDDDFAEIASNFTLFVSPNRTTTDLNLVSGSQRLFIDMSDSRKLKYEVTSAPSSGSHWMRVIATKSPKQTSATPTIVVN